MTAGMTPNDSGTATTSPRLYPNRAAPVPATISEPSGPDSPGTPRDPNPESGHSPSDRQGSPEGDQGPAGDTDTRVPGRQEVRAARKRRRRLSIGCAVVLTVCTAITLLIVGLARDHTPSSLGVVPVAQMASSVGVRHHTFPDITSMETPDAPASVGGNR